MPIVALSGVAWIADGMYFEAIRQGVIGLALGVALCTVGSWFDQRRKIELNKVY